MIMALDKNWLTSIPFDYELKYYRLMAGIQLMQSSINSYELYSVLEEIEVHLHELYVIKHNRDIVDERLKVLKGIDIDTMTLSYEYQQNDPTVEELYELCDKGIEELEELYKKLRERWRTAEKNIRITEIPERRFLHRKGFVFLVLEDETILKTFSFDFPGEFSKTTWKEVELNEEAKTQYMIRKISSFISTIEGRSEDYRFFRVDVKKNYPVEDCVIPIVKHSIFNTIKKYS